MINVQLNYNHGYKWFSHNGIYVKGYVFDEDNVLYKEDKLLNYFENIKTEEEFKDSISNANGIFSVIIKNDDCVMVAVDTVRTFPIFYLKNKNEFVISDDTYYLKENYRCSIDKATVDEFLTTRYVTGDETLLKNVYQVQSGEYLILSKNKLVNNFYFDYLTHKVSDKSYDNLKLDFLNILRELIERMIILANGRQIVLPLSGGYDSRLIASLLKQANYENVFCFTYGSVDSFEVDISQKVANELGYDWYFIKYDKETVPKNYPQSEEFKKYYKFNSNHVSVFSTQDYFAVKFLHDNKIINTNAIFVPGHSGDFLGGSHLGKTEIADKDNLIDVIYKKHCSLNKYSINSILKSKILSLTNGSQINSKFYYSIDENFNLKERQSKMIVNTNRTYEYFGYQHAIPLWDKELVIFFRQLPLEYKLNSFFFNKVIIEDIFNGMNIGFIKNDSPILKKVVNRIKKIIPIFIKNTILELKFNDINKASLRVNPLLNEIDENIHFSNSNLIVVKWYIMKVKQN
jgi:asparagine synthase (glutamine-hydrolysing)